MKKNYLLIAFSLFLLAACSPDREKQIAAIEKHESELSMLDVSVDEEKAHEMIGLYRQFVSDFPDDSLAPVYLMRVADISITLGETEQAVNVLDSIINIYPGFAADTRKMLPYIGLSPEEMFEAIMNNATDQNLTMK